ncbi:MAG: carboxypeptidase regulatory-like domain-containing protein [Elusimicrobia bacterium]|nr:carboxypeptidase regulatory-like domain-containing protein [Elusimicrobiota bacterium]
MKKFFGFDVIARTKDEAISSLRLPRANKLALAMTLCVASYFLLFTSCLSAVQLIVETGVAGANVVAVNFGTPGNPPTVIPGTADSSGKAVLEILSDTDYRVFATKHGKGPSIRDQVMMQKSIPVKTAFPLPVSLLLNEDLTNVGIIRIGVVNISTGVAFMGDIRNVITNEPVAFLQDFPSVYGGSVDSKSTGYINVPNIPAAPADTYNINIFSPNDNKALNKPLTLPVSADASGSNPTSIFFDFDTRDAMAAQTQDTGITPEGDVAFEGMVVTSTGGGIPDMNVQLEGRDAGAMQPQIRFQTQTDKNGRFTFYNIPIGKYYEIGINGLGYEGVWDYPQLNGSGQGGYYYTGTKIVVPSQITNGQPWNYGETKQKYELSAVYGRLKGIVKIGATALPFADVQIWGDWDRWQGTDMFSSSTDWKNTSSPSNGRVRTKSDGTFDLVRLSTGNITLAVFSDLIGVQYIYNYNGDWNARDAMNSNGFRIIDGKENDLRVTISSETPTVDNYPGWAVYSASGVVISSAPADVVINIETDGPAACTIKGTIKFLEEASIPANNPILIIAREEFQGDWSNHKSKSRFTSISGNFLKGGTTDYVINVSSGVQYWVDVKAEYLGIVNRFDTRADFSNITSGERVLDFALAPAGKIRGVVRLPDGTIFKPVNDKNGRWIHVRANSRVSNGDNNVPDSGVFEITGLIPGLYNVSTYGSGSGYVWPRTTQINDVMVSPNKETYIEIPLTNGVKCEALAPYPMPSMPARTTGYYYICGFPSDEILTGHKIDALMDSNSDTPVSFEYSISTYNYYNPTETKSLSWQPTLAAPGRYNLYLIKYEMFGGAGEMDWGMMRSENQTITIISQAKNFEIKYDSLQPNATTYIPFEGAVTGKGKITGKITGNNIWTSADYEKGKKEGGDAMMKNIPTVMLYDINGIWRGFSGARPKNDIESLKPWMLFFIAPNEITKNNAMKNSPVSYYVDMLPPGKYIMVAETPNYPPFMKEVVIYSTATTTLDLDFDAMVGIGLSISGTVTSTDGVKLEGAEVVVQHKSVSKYTITDSSGNYSIAGLPKGIYRISVSKSGYALAGDKIGIGESVTAKNFQLTKADSALAGVVFSQKIPFAKTLANAKIACYDETYNTTPGNEKKYLPVNKAKTDKNGNYYISGLISGHIYKVYVMVPGKIVEYVDITPVAGDNNQDFELKSLSPKLKIIVKKTENPRKYLFMFSSPKKLVAPPECWYNQGDSYDENKAIQALPLSGPNNTYSLYVNLLESNINQNYNLRVISDDGGKKNTDDIKFGGNVKRQAKKDVAEGIAEGDDVAIDELGDDNTQIGLDAGCLTASTVTVSASPGRGAPSFAIGGFSTNIPSFKLQGTDSSIATELINVDESAVASDVYQVDLTNSQMNKSVTLSLNYDKEKVSETDIDKLKIYQYNSDKRIWELVPGSKTIDPVSGTVSIDVESISDAASSTSTTRLSGRAVVQNGRFVVNRAASSSQSGVFAVFKSQPSTNITWTGDFRIFNFPNPFNLKEKIVTLTDGGALGVNLTTKGTVIKYCLPSAKSGNVKLYIYNLAGELVREIDDGDRTGGFIYYAEWDGRNDRNDECASGVYFALLKVGNKTLNNKKPLKLAIIK